MGSAIRFFVEQHDTGTGLTLTQLISHGSANNTSTDDGKITFCHGYSIEKC